MRKFVLSIICGVTSVLAWAEYPFMAFRTVDGDEHTISTTGLEISLGDGVLTATAADEKVQIPLASLASMQFTDKGAKAGSITADADAAVEVFGTDGIPAGKFASVKEATRALRAGIYVFKNKKGDTWKIAVQK